jgi:peroxiredoxin
VGAKGLRSLWSSLLATACLQGVAASCGAPLGPQGSVGAAGPQDPQPGGSAVAPADEPSSAPRAPDFELETLDGERVRLSDVLHDRVVLIDFWATFCDPCLASFPHLEEIYRRHKDEGFVILGVSIDGPDSIAQVRSEVAKAGVSFPILLDEESRVLSRYNPQTSAPFSVLVGRDGRIIKKQEGYTTASAAQLERDVSAALARR